MSNDFSMTAGDDKVLVVPVTDSETGAVVDLTGASQIRWQLAKSVNSASALIEKALGTGVEITDADGGVFEVTLDSADTQDIRGEFYHEAEVIDAAGKISTVVTGLVTINRDLIKPA